MIADSRDGCQRATNKETLAYLILTYHIYLHNFPLFCKFWQAKIEVGKLCWYFTIQVRGKAHKPTHTCRQKLKNVYCLAIIDRRVNSGPPCIFLESLT